MNKPWGEIFFIEFLAKNKKIDKNKMGAKLKDFLISKSQQFESKEYLEQVINFDTKYKNFDLDYYQEKSQELLNILKHKDDINLNLDLFYTLVVEKYKL